MEVMVFGLVQLGRKGSDLVDVFHVQIPLVGLKELRNVLAYWSHGLEGYEWFGLRHLAELVVDLAFGAMFWE